MAGEVSRKVVVIRKKPPTAKVDLVEVAPAEHAVASHGSGPSITLICPSMATCALGVVRDNGKPLGLGRHGGKQCCRRFTR